MNKNSGQSERRPTGESANQNGGQPESQRKEAYLRKPPLAAVPVSRRSGWPPFWLAAVLFCVASVHAAGTPPTIFFTDLQSGPNTGGESNNGTILTIYGKNFGTTAGTVTIGGGAVAKVYQWGVPSFEPKTNLQKISVAIGAAAKT